MPRPFRPLAAFLAVPLLSFAQDRIAADDPGVSVNAGASLRHRAPVHYPKGTIVAGTVEIEAVLNASGEVADARVVSGPEELRKEALLSVLQWHYGPDAPAPVHISIRFDPAPNILLPRISIRSDLSPTPKPARVEPAQPNDFPSATEDFVSGFLKSIEFTGLGPEAENELRARLPFGEGDPLRHSDLDRIADIVSQFDDHLVANFTGQIAAPDAHRDLTVHIHAMAPSTTVFIGPQDTAVPAVRKK